MRGGSHEPAFGDCCYATIFHTQAAASRFSRPEDGFFSATVEKSAIQAVFPEETQKPIAAIEVMYK